MQVQNAHFSRAKALHLEGRFPQAEAMYLYLLEQNPGDSETLHLLGLLHADTNRFETGIQLLRVAIAIEGPKPWLCRNLGVILERCGDSAAAIACYRQALVEAPHDHELWAATAAVLTREERQQDAADCWKQALESNTCTTYRAGWANALALSGDRPAAIAQYEILLAQEPDHIEATFHCAVAYMQESKEKPAIAGFLRTLELAPCHARAANNLGILYQLEKNYEQAIGYYQRSIRADPEYDAAIYNLGTAWQERNQPRRAICVFRKVLQRKPDHAAAWTNLGNAWLAWNAIDAAISCYRKTLALRPEETAAAWNLGIVSLLNGDLQSGWAGYEQRFDVPGATPRRAFATPLWRGESLTGKTLILHAEQGIGDTLQFVRYAPIFASQGARIVVECQTGLLPLLVGMEGVAVWVGARKDGSVDHLPAADFQLPLLSAPAITGTALDTIPLPEGYLHAPATSARKWKRWLGAPTRQLRVGVCWAGNPNHKNDMNRSISAPLLAMLEAVPTVEWVNLQKGHPMPAAPDMRNAARELHDFADTAGLIENLDLILSVDTSVAHLAGALGKPVWVMLPYAPDWRWMLDRSDSPWYAKARLFRQSERGNWIGVLREVAEALRELRR
jgi:tetratricopeptide (TPR) repeat protein